MYLSLEPVLILHIHVNNFLLQASSDLSILDFDIPFSIIFIVAAGVELLTTIGIMASVTWQVLIVAIFAIIATRYVQVDPSIHILDFLNLFLQSWNDKAII